MKVAVVSGGSPDYLIDIVADGLIRLLGRDRVHLDYNRWGSPGGCFSQLMQGFEPDGLTTEECDILVVSNRGTVDAVQRYRTATSGRVAVLDGEDGGGLHHELLELSDVYFLREYLCGTSYPKKVRPLSFGAIPEAVERAHVRNTALTFAAGDTSIDRVHVRTALAAESWTVSDGSRHDMDHDEFMRRLGRTRIGVNVRGAGWDTYRYWETPWSGALLLSQQLGIVIEKNFVPDIEAVFFNSPEEAVSKAKSLLADEPRRAEIAAAGLRATEERHLSTHRAARVLDVLEIR